MISYSTIPMKAIADGAKIYSGFAFKSTDFKKSGVPIIKIGNLIKDGSVSYDNCDYFPLNEITPSHSDFILNDRDILIAMTGQGSVGRVCQIRINKNEIVLLNQRVGKISVDINIFDRDYLFFVLSSHKYAEILFSAGYGSGQPNLSPDVISSIKIPYLDLSQQHKIGILLISLEDKIRNNYQIITELESLAKNTYDYWFLQFEFPDENGKPYKSSGGKLIWNNELKREIPNGWVPGILSDVASIVMGSSPSGEMLNESGLGIPFYQGSTDFGFLYPSERVYTDDPKRFADDGSILFSVRAPVGDMNITPKRCCIGRGVAALSSTEIGFLFNLLKSLKPMFDPYNNAGTTFGDINRDSLSNIKIILPPKELRETFEKTVHPLYEKMKVRFIEAKELENLRDFLLPVLMNGQAKIAD